MPASVPQLALAAVAALSGCFAGLDEAALTGAPTPAPGADGGASPPQRDAGPPGVLCDDFSTDAIGATPAGWTIASGQWLVSPSDNVHALAQLAPSGNGPYVASENAPSFNDYLVTATVRASGNGSDCVLARFADERNHYALCLRNGSSWSLGRVRDGNRQTLESGSFFYDGGSLHELGLQLRDGDLTPTVDGDTKDTVSDGAFGSGPAGLSTSGGLTAHKVCVEKL